ncbi:MAG: 1-deoxy-D-xylulose-5-phosphate synthase [Deltaproteobacteria bacterium]|nr:1-deoxy-D-xylulose-5-phosphate synthase [Deltaproteobacteria bacterium]
MDQEIKANILDNINSPADIKGLSIKQLETLAEEIRQEMIKTVSRTGGHLAPSLGVVELTIAIHYVFNTPEDKVVWDVGHQAYAHKLLTGRRDLFHTLRSYKGISGFPKMSESAHDAFDTGHSSTSISAGLGMTTGKELKGENSKVIAVIGDGSMSAGMAYEGMNQAGHTEKDLIVILNDNEMSISPNVGAFSSFISRKMTGRRFVNFKNDLGNFLKSVPGMGENILGLIKKSEDSLMTFFTPGMLFEAFKFQYIGPINGHRLDLLIDTLKNTRNIKGPVLIHIMTVKGKGYGPAEKNPVFFHGVGPFDISTGLPVKPAGQTAPNYTRVFGDTMVELAARDKRIFAITAAMPEGTGLNEFAKKFPARFLDVGIAEQHAVTFAAGLATEGFKPFVAIYSTFLQRAFDQVIHDVCLPDLPVVFCLDRGGLVGDDGPTHHGHFDITYMRSLPNMTVMAPKDENELRHMLFTALNHNGPIAIRYPRGAGIGVPLDVDLKAIPIGESEPLREGRDIVIFALGSMVYPSMQAAEILENEGISAGVINCRSVKPLDKRLIEWAQAQGRRVLTVEENIIQGGFGSAILELFNENGIRDIIIKRIGLPDRFIEQGPTKVLRESLGLDAKGIAEAVRQLFKN